MKMICNEFPGGDIMFIVVGFILSIFAMIENIYKKINKNKIFNILWLILTVMLMCRYGQGTDYHEYEVMYEFLNSDDSLFSNSLVHGEYGWYLLMLLSKKVGINFYIFTAFISFIMMYLTYKSINKFIGSSLLSIMLLYPTFYLTYYYSAMRQGLTLSIFLYYGISFLYEKKYIRYFILILMLSCLHRASIILFLIPFGIKIISINRSLFAIFGIISSYLISISGLLDNIMAITERSYSDVRISYLAIVLRVVLYLFALLLHNKIKRYKVDSFEQMLFNIYTLGFILYLCLAVYATLSQRITMPFKAVEIILFPLQISILCSLIENKHKIQTVYFLLARGKRIIWCVLFLVIVCDIEFVKNIFSYIEQGNYYEWVTPLNYPYISVFEDKSNIYKYISHFD